MRRLLREQQGASSVIVALCMTVVLIVVALVVDIGATAARKAQLQDAADAAAMAIAQQCYESSLSKTSDGCDPAVAAGAGVLAQQIARDTVNDRVVDLVAEPDFSQSTETVVVQLTSFQQGLFSWAAAEDGANVLATATAEWRQTVPLPLAVNSCVLPDPATADLPTFVGTGVYTGVEDLLRSVAGALGRSDFDLRDYLENIFDCGVSVLAGGWLGNPDNECSYDPQALTSTLGATVDRLLPVLSDSEAMCRDTIQSLVGKRIIVPVFEHATGQTVGQLVGIYGNITFAEIIVTGYEFDGLLGNGPAPYFPNGGPRCATSLNELLGLSGTGLPGLLNGLTRGPLETLLQLPVVAQVAAFLGLDRVLDFLADVLSILFPPALSELVDNVLAVLLPVLSLCQGVQGEIVTTGMTAEQASARLDVHYRLVS